MNPSSTSGDRVRARHDRREGNDDPVRSSERCCVVDERISGAQDRISGAQDDRRPAPNRRDRVHLDVLSRYAPCGTQRPETWHGGDQQNPFLGLALAVQTPAIQAAMIATTQIPIVMIAGAPVETGLVASLSRPGGNVTGLSTTGPEVAAKTLDILRDTIPSLRRVAVLLEL